MWVFSSEVTSLVTQTVSFCHQRMTGNLTFCWNFRRPFRENNFRLRAESFSNLVQTYFRFWWLRTANLAFDAMATCSSHWTDILAMGWALNPWWIFFDFWTSFLSQCIRRFFIFIFNYSVELGYYTKPIFIQIQTDRSLIYCDFCPKRTVQRNESGRSGVANKDHPKDGSV